MVWLSERLILLALSASVARKASKSSTMLSKSTGVGDGCGVDDGGMDVAVGDSIVDVEVGVGIIVEVTSTLVISSDVVCEQAGMRNMKNVMAKTDNWYGFMSTPFLRLIDKLI